MELGTYNLTDTMLKLICSNFNVDKVNIYNNLEIDFNSLNLL